MSTVVNAGSLADVIQLADNPPSQLQDRNLANVQQPLVLYIVRVPGSRGMTLLSVSSAQAYKKLDVFLTTMKPQQKVVTAQDVQSSLYYLHAEKADDYKLLEPPNHQISVRRKPVLQRHDLDRSRDTQMADIPAQAYSQVPHIEATIHRKPLHAGARQGHMSLGAVPTLPARKLLGPRAMNQRLHSVDNSALQNVPERQNIDMRRWSEQPGSTPPRLPPRTDIVHRKELEIKSFADGELVEEQRRSSDRGHKEQHCWDWEKSWEEKRAVEAREEMARISSEWQSDREHYGGSEDSSLILIRRYNGEQWNVGKINSRGTGYRAGGISDAEIFITTKGYSKFVHFQRSETSSSLSSTTGDNSLPVEDISRCFRRHFQGSRYSMNNANPSPSRLQPSADDDSSSTEHFQSRRDTYIPTPNTERYKTSSPKKYMLQSPWSGLCEFTTGIAGRSLKCKHSYASRDPEFGLGIRAAPVSELRFNLPNSTVLGKSAAKSQKPDSSRDRKRSSRFLGSYHRRASSSYGRDDEGTIPETEFEHRLDVSLGQEHAGGGFGGKQAKLGKLIVEAEGLQMLDFVVAANLALWWKIYGRIT